MSDDSDNGNKAASTSQSSDNASPLLNRKRRRKQLIVSSEDESSSGSENEEIIAFQEQRRPETQNGGNHLGSGLAEAVDAEFPGLHIAGDSYFEKYAAFLELREEGSSESSSDNDDQAERCPVCLAKFKDDQHVASLESCDHSFCVLCIHKWSKNANTCPIDRQQFSLILIRKRYGGEVVKHILLPPPNTQSQDQEEEDTTACEVCHQSNNEDRMLLCDYCNRGYHMECLDPQLDSVPLEEWYCPRCLPFMQVEQSERQSARRRGQTRRRQSRVEEDEGIEDPEPPPNRISARTRRSESVRQSMGLRPTGVQTRQIGNLLQEPSTSVERIPRRPRQRRGRKRATTRPRFRVKRIVTDDGVIEVLLKRKKRRKYKKTRRTKAPARTVKRRLARSLGMCAPQCNNQFIPETINRQSTAQASINHQRHQAGIPTIDIFGRREQLEYFSGSDGEEESEAHGGGGVGLLSQSRLMTRPQDRIFRLKRAATILNSTRIKRPTKKEPIPSPASSSLLDSIMDSQTLWHSKQAKITSKSDGTLQVTLPKSSNNLVRSDGKKSEGNNPTAPILEAPMFPSGRSNSGVYNLSNTTRESQSQGGERGGGEQSYGGQESTTSGGSASTESSGSCPLRGVAPIRFRMSLPPKRPNIHSYPSDNIPPPPPLRLRSPIVETNFPVTNSPEVSPTRDEEEVDIYGDIEQATTNNEAGDDKSFGTLLPPPEPPFPLTMEPPPAFPALLSMSLNDDPSDDEATGLVIADEPVAEDEYDPCAVNSDDSSNEEQPLAKPPDIPVSLVNPELVANYSSDSASDPPYNPELPTYTGTPIIGPLPRPASHHSSCAEEDNDDCPNFSMYSAESMNLARRGMSIESVNLDIPIPPVPQMVTSTSDCDIPLPDSPKANQGNHNLDVPIPLVIKSDAEQPEKEAEESKTCSNELNTESEDNPKMFSNNNLNDSDDESSEGEGDSSEGNSNSEISESEKDEPSESEKEDNNDVCDSDNNVKEKDNENSASLKQNYEKGASMDGDKISDKIDSAEEKVENAADPLKNINDLVETAEDECSTQGDVLELAIEPETNIDTNMNHDDIEQNKKCNQKIPLGEEDEDKNLDGGDKSDGLVDITDEEMSVYDSQDNDETIFDQTTNNQTISKLSLYSDDDNSLVGGATSAISGGTLHNSDNVHPPPTLPGLEGLETEIISESEDVNFDDDDLPADGAELPEVNIDQEEYNATKKKKKKKNRKISHDDDKGIKGSVDPLDFEEGEIVEDKPKQLQKKDKKSKLKHDNLVKDVENKVSNKIGTTGTSEKDPVAKKAKKKKDKVILGKEKSDKSKELKEKTLKPGKVDENLSWKKLSKSTKDRHYRDGKERDSKEKDLENKDYESSKKDKRSREKRKELERYNVRRLISEKPKLPKKDEFGRDISPSNSGSSLSPYRPPRYRSPLRTRNRSRSRSKSWKSRSRSRERRRRSRSREKGRSRERLRKSRSKDKGAKRSRSRNKVSNHSRERRRTPERKRTRTPDRKKIRSPERVKRNRSLSRSRRRSKTPLISSRRRSYSRSWSLSWSRSSFSRSRSLSNRRRSRSFTRSKSKSWPRDKHFPSVKKAKLDRSKNLTVIVTNKEALKKKEKKKASKKKDDQRKKRYNQPPAPSKEVFTSGDNILVSVNFKNATKAPEIAELPTPVVGSKRKRDEDVITSKKKKSVNSIKKTTPIAKKNSKNKVNEAARNAKPVAIIDLDLSPFREMDMSPKEVIVLSDSGDEGDKQHSERLNESNQLGNNGINQSLGSNSSSDHKQKSSITQPESPLSSNFMLLNSSGPKTPPEPHIKFSISTKASQVRLLSNPLLEVDEELQDENIEDDDEVLHKGPNTPPEPPPGINTPASPPTTPYDPFDPTKSRSSSPQPLHNTSREDKLENLQSENEEPTHSSEPRISPPSKDLEDLKKTPELTKVHSTPKSDPIFGDLSPQASPVTGISDTSKPLEESLPKPIQKLLNNSNKLDSNVHKSPEKLVTVVGSQQQVKITSQIPKPPVQPLKALTPNKHQTPKGHPKQLFSSSIVKQVPILGALSLLSSAPPYNPSFNLNNNSKPGGGRMQQNGGDPSDDMDIDPSSPYSPGSSEGDDLFEPPMTTPPKSSSKTTSKTKSNPVKSAFDALFGSPPPKSRHSKHSSSKTNKKSFKSKSKGSKKEDIKVKLDEDQLKILDDLPSSAVEMQFLKKLNRQERVVEEVKLVLKPHYGKKHVTKEEYKEILRRAVPKICHNKSGEINPTKIHSLIEAYVKKFRYAKKKAAGGTLPSATQNKPKPQKTLWS